ncbi:unnamed protein product, partial [Closterium sp. Naga37s-1]
YIGVMTEAARIFAHNYSADVLLLNSGPPLPDAELYSLFNKNVCELGAPWDWPRGPMVCPLDIVFRACSTMHTWLAADDDHVAVLHTRSPSNAGGACFLRFIAACYLSHSTLFPSPSPTPTTHDPPSSPSSPFPSTAAVSYLPPSLSFSLLFSSPILPHPPPFSSILPHPPPSSPILPHPPPSSPILLRPPSSPSPIRYPFPHSPPQSPQSAQSFHAEFPSAWQALVSLPQPLGQPELATWHPLPPEELGEGKGEHGGQGELGGNGALGQQREEWGEVVGGGQTGSMGQQRYCTYVDEFVKAGRGDEVGSTGQQRYCTYVDEFVKAGWGDEVGAVRCYGSLSTITLPFPPHSPLSRPFPSPCQPSLASLPPAAPILRKLILSACPSIDGAGVFRPYLKVFRRGAEVSSSVLPGEVRLGGVRLGGVRNGGGEVWTKRREEAVKYGQVAPGQVAFGQVASGQVASGQVASGQVASGQVASAQVASGQVASSQCAYGQIISREKGNSSRDESEPVFVFAFHSAFLCIGLTRITLHELDCAYGGDIQVPADFFIDVLIDMPQPRGGTPLADAANPDGAPAGMMLTWQQLLAAYRDDFVEASRKQRMAQGRGETRLGRAEGERSEREGERSEREGERSEREGEEGLNGRGSRTFPSDQQERFKPAFSQSALATEAVDGRGRSAPLQEQQRDWRGGEGDERRSLARSLVTEVQAHPLLRHTGQPSHPDMLSVPPMPPGTAFMPPEVPFSRYSLPPTPTTPHMPPSPHSPLPHSPLPQLASLSEDFSLSHSSSAAPLSSASQPSQELDSLADLLIRMSLSTGSRHSMGGGGLKGGERHGMGGGGLKGGELHGMRGAGLKGGERHGMGGGGLKGVDMHSKGVSFEQGGERHSIGGGSVKGRAVGEGSMVGGAERMGQEGSLGGKGTMGFAGGMRGEGSMGGAEGMGEERQSMGNWGVDVSAIGGEGTEGMGGDWEGMGSGDAMGGKWEGKGMGSEDVGVVREVRDAGGEWRAGAGEAKGDRLRASATRDPKHVLPPDRLGLLLQVIPTEEEAAKFRAVSGAASGAMCAPERFLWSISLIPRMRRKIEALMFVRHFHTIVNDARAVIKVFCSAARAIRSSKVLRAALAAALEVGNELNRGSARGSARGFSLDSLARLSEVRVTPPSHRAKGLDTLTPAASPFPSHQPHPSHPPLLIARATTLLDVVVIITRGGDSTRPNEGEEEAGEVGSSLMGSSVRNKGGEEGARGRGKLTVELGAVGEAVRMSQADVADATSALDTGLRLVDEEVRLLQQETEEARLQEGEEAEKQQVEEREERQEDGQGGGLDSEGGAERQRKGKGVRQGGLLAVLAEFRLNARKEREELANDAEECRSTLRQLACYLGESKPQPSTSDALFASLWSFATLFDRAQAALDM